MSDKPKKKVDGSGKKRHGSQGGVTNSDEEFEARFETMLDDLAFDSKKKKTMRSLPDFNRKALVENHEEMKKGGLAPSQKPKPIGPVSKKRSMTKLKSLPVIADDTVSPRGSGGFDPSTGKFVSPRRQSRQSGPSPRRGTSIQSGTTDEMFGQLLDQLGVNAEQRAVMFMLPEENKRVLLEKHKDMAERQEVESPENYVKMLSKKGGPKMEEFTRLRVQLATAPIPWIEEFLEKKGLKVAVSVLGDKVKKYRSKEDGGVLTESVRSLKALMNTKCGMEEFVAHPRGVSALISVIGPPEDDARTLLYEILAAFCVVASDGHRLLLHGLKQYAADNKEASRFRHVVESLSNDANVDHQIAAMFFCNAMISTPEDLPTRMKIRNEFLALGIRTVIQEKLASSPNKLLLTQVEVFDEEANEDEKEQNQYLELIESIDAEDPENVFFILHQLAKGKAIYPSFLSTLQHIVGFSSDTNVGERIWIILNSIMEQLYRLLQANNGDDEGAEYTLSMTGLTQVAATRQEIENLKKSLKEARMNPGAQRGDIALSHGNLPATGTRHRPAASQSHPGAVGRASQAGDRKSVV
eukprot:TRINITY_DN1014_c1_g1_i1.p1 TRINITY_DN1014_c1_g1~~TRINITY_DN1014_c1_g1_i1.p1  ORF type:complete len:581 (+),score=172.99 TRINITY_DN1014_c1_g1_i1:173-1915(+)